MSPGNRNCLCSLKIAWHALMKTNASHPLRIFREFQFIAQGVRNAYSWCYHCYSQEQLLERVANWSVL